MQLFAHHIKDNSWSIGVQADETQPTYYYPALYISTDGISFNLYPCVRTIDEVDELLKSGLFKPSNPQQKDALSRHNLRHYRHSLASQSFFRTRHNVQGLEQIAEEQNYMNEMGIAFYHSSS
ncbi:hypothetical protein [Legionella shakespearei]|uniref:Uncharacterized protein n=1 Tax=Legionella shakespearei DSM 23087 TaxID=1122169 RepID=A0A0W0ZBN6_9GAMM|nr:hypothetical protein [Legionella shakespearei]KTD66431.1 hypothetical protein Lsha_0113 [Legionella shakespearei DSM 23087]